MISTLLICQTQTSAQLQSYAAETIGVMFRKGKIRLSLFYTLPDQHTGSGGEAGGSQTTLNGV